MYLDKEGANSIVLHLKREANDLQFFDLHDMNQIIIMTHFILGINPDSIVPVTAFMVTQNINTKVQTKTPLSIVTCISVEAKLKELRINVKPGEFLEYQNCLIVPKGSYIGYDRKLGIKKTLQLEVWPCMSGCYSMTFPMIGNQEISPINPFNAFFPVYQTFMKPFSLGY